MKFQLCLIVILFQLGIQGYSQNNRPNILLIVADDLGYSDIGAYGGEIATPVLDKIAKQSIQFSNFHTLPTCAPTRAMLLTGTDNHIAGIGAQYGITTKEQEGQPGYEGQLNYQVSTLPEVLQALDYRTYQVGKWHLGHDEEHLTYKRGFQETFNLMQGGGSHYADQIPVRTEEGMVYRRNGQLIKELPEDFYSTKNYTDSLLSWLIRDTLINQPFFAYLAYTAPHDPLHAPLEYIEKYKGKYDEGYEVLHKKRFEALQKKGFISKEHPLPDWSAAITKWDNLSTQEKQASSRNMEVYAAMIDYMDEQIGRIYQQLQTTGQLDNTLIIFMSDNGANGFNPVVGYRQSEDFQAQFDNSIDNRGLPNSFVAMQAGWAMASTAAYRFFKGFTTEGGIRTPCFIKMPNTNLAGQLNHAFVHVSDLMPTILNLLQAEHPSNQNKDLAPMKGLSMLNLINGKAEEVHQGKSFGMELHGTRALIKGEWKILQSPMPLGSGDWELYNLKEDPFENKNLIFSNYSKYKELLTAHQAYEKEVGVIYGLPVFLGKAMQVFTPIFWLLIAIFSLAIFGKLSGKLKDNYIKWGYGTKFMYALAITELIAVGGLFTLLNQYAAWFLLIIMGGAFFTLIKNRENWKAYLLPLFTTTLLGLFLLLKSGKLVSLLF